MGFDQTERILAHYGKADLGVGDIMPEIRKYVFGKNYAIFVFFNNAEKIEPFDINKSGFGAMTARITINDVNKLKK